MILPTVHTGGTPATRLLAAALAARDAISKAIEAVNETAPHLRDYPQAGHSLLGHPCAHPTWKGGAPCPFHPRAVSDGALAFAQATNAHRERVRGLNDLREEMSALADHVTDAIDAATAQRESVLTNGTQAHDERDQT